MPPKRDANGEPQVASTKRDRHWGWTLYPDKWEQTSIFNPMGKPNWDMYAAFLKQAVEAKKMDFVVFSTENCPETGKLHYQGYSQFSNPVSMKQVKEILSAPFVHLWLPKGSAEQNRKYARKGLDDNDPTYAGFTFEYGTFGLCSQGARTDIVEFASDIKEKGVTDAALASPGMYMKYSGGAHKLEALYVAERVAATAQNNGSKRCEWIWGNPGLGKSYYWRWFCEGKPYYYLEEPVKNGQVWWDNYKGETTLILDDAQGNLPARLLLELADPYGKDIQKPVKGSFIRVFFTHIIITSNMSIDVAYKAESHAIQALKRRFMEFHMTAQWRPPSDHAVDTMLRRLIASATTTPQRYLEWWKHQHRDDPARREADMIERLKTTETMEETLPAPQEQKAAGGASDPVPSASQMASAPSGTLFRAPLGTEPRPIFRYSFGAAPASSSPRADAVAESHQVAQALFASTFQVGKPAA